MAATLCIFGKSLSVNGSCYSDIAMSRRYAGRERNGRGLKLFMQNLKGIISLFLAPQDVAWTEELTEETFWRLEEAYATLTLMENDISRVSD